MKELESSVWFLLLLVPMAGVILVHALTEGRRGRRWAGLTGSKSQRTHPQQHSA